MGGGFLMIYDNKWMTPQILNPFMPSGIPTQTNILVSEMFFLDSEKKFLHLFFLDKALRDFLINLPIKDFDDLASISTKIKNLYLFGLSEIMLDLFLLKNTTIY